MIDEKRIKELYGETHTYMKVSGVVCNLDSLHFGQSVCWGDGETYHWLLTKKKELHKTVAYWKETMETWSELVAKVDDVTGEIISNPYEAVELKKVIDSLDVIFTNVSKHEGIATNCELNREERT